MALGLLPTDELAALRVLVVHTNFAVGSAIVRRLIDANVIALSHVTAVLGGHQEPDRYHAVLVGPYLQPEEREALLEACLAGGRATVVELLDSETGSQVVLHRAGSGSPAAADLLATALALPLTTPGTD
jgi:hypothetical protein